MSGPRPGSHKRASNRALAWPQSCIRERASLILLILLGRSIAGSRWEEEVGGRLVINVGFCLGKRIGRDAEVDFHDCPSIFNKRPRRSLLCAGKDARSASTMGGGRTVTYYYSSTGLACEPRGSPSNRQAGCGIGQGGQEEKLPPPFSYPCTTTHTAEQASC